jgi:hypothetical protein
LIIYLPFRPWPLIPLVFLNLLWSNPDIYPFPNHYRFVISFDPYILFPFVFWPPFLYYRAIPIISLRPLVRIFGPSLNLTSFGPYILWPKHPLARTSFGPYILWPEHPLARTSFGPSCHLTPKSFDPYAFWSLVILISFRVIPLFILILTKTVLLFRLDPYVL